MKNTMMGKILFLLFISLVAFDTAATEPVAEKSDILSLKNPDVFDIPPPIVHDATLQIWATSYYMIPISAAKDNLAKSVPFRDKNGLAISDNVSPAEWCLGSQEGSIKTTFHGQDVRLVHAGEERMTDHFIDCTQYYPNVDVYGYGFNYHKKTNSPYGHGTNNWFLVPYRTIAIQLKNNHELNLQAGQVIYIEQLKGQPIMTLPSGEILRHDGYFFVGDSGSKKKIKGNHIDVFCGFQRTCLGKFTAGDANHHILYSAQVINDSAVISRLRGLHLSSSYK